MKGGTVHIDLLGGFRVVRGDGSEAGPWPGRRATELVALLALADGRRLPREQVIDALWRTLDAQAGAANLRKAAHHARTALGDPEAVVLKGGQVALLPGRDVVVDVDEFERAGSAGAYAGELLPEFPYEDWTQAPRERLRALHLEHLRNGQEWERVVQADPTDEPAYRELMRRDLAAGSRPAAIRWYGRLRTALRRELGIAPGAETQALYEECVAGLETGDPELVGRQLELATATAALRGGSPALVVRGPAGIGKSALCREVARGAEREGLAVVAVRAAEDAGPYAPVAAVVEQLAERDRGVLDAAGPRARSVLSELTVVAGPAEPLGRQLTRHEVIGAFRRLLEAAGGGAPVALLVDDAHLADEATVDLLLHLGGPRLALVLAYRPEAARETLTRGVARMVRGGRAVAIDLGPLDPADAALLVEAGAATPRSAGVTDRIVELAEGNPFLTLEMARSAVAGVPALLGTARAAIASRFLDFDATALDVLEHLALAGDTLDPASIVALSGRPEAEAFAVLDRALRAGVLVVAGGRYRFRHELVRQALAEQLPPHQRLTVHRETAERLAAAGANPGLVARHWIAGGRPGQATSWLLAAARQAVALGAFGDALAELALLLAHEPASPEGLRLRAEALDAIGDLGAPAAYAAAARVVDTEEADDLRAKQGLALVKLGDPPAGLRAVEGIAPRSVDGRLAHALTLCGAAALGFADPEHGTAKAAEARRLAIESDDPGALLIASWAHAAAAHARGDLRASVQADLHDTHAMPRLAVSVFDGQLCITQRLLYGARPYADVIAFADSLAAEADRLGAARGKAFAVTIRGEAKLLSGDIEGADADLAAGVELHRALGAATGEAFALQRRSEVALARGNDRRAQALLDEALAVARESDVGFHLLDRIYGAKVTAARSPEEGLAALEEAEEAVRGPVETCPGCRITLAVPAAIAAARGGDLERAAAWEQSSEYLAEVVMRLPAWDAALEEVRGHRARAEGDEAAATARFRAAAAGFAAAGQPLDEARCAALAEPVAAER